MPRVRGRGRARAGEHVLEIVDPAVRRRLPRLQLLERVQTLPDFSRAGRPPGGHQGRTAASGLLPGGGRGPGTLGNAARLRPGSSDQPGDRGSAPAQPAHPRAAARQRWRRGQAVPCHRTGTVHAVAATAARRLGIPAPLRRARAASHVSVRARISPSAHRLHAGESRSAGGNGSAARSGCRRTFCFFRTGSRRGTTCECDSIQLACGCFLLLALRAGRRRADGVVRVAAVASGSAAARRRVDAFADVACSARTRPSADSSSWFRPPRPPSHCSRCLQGTGPLLGLWPLSIPGYVVFGCCRRPGLHGR